jgi:uncharacterized protein YcfJ
MEQAVPNLILLGLAAALSSVPISATIFILLSERRTRSGLAFLAGTVLGTSTAVTLATVTSQALPGRTRQHDALLGKLMVAIGIAMVLWGVVNLARRNRTTDSDKPGWVDGIGSMSSLPVFGIGLALNLRPKALLLVGAAGVAISKADLRFDGNGVLIALYTAVATCTVVVPIVATILFPRQMTPRLLSARQRIVEHSTTVGATMMILVGGFVIGIGILG